MRRAERLPRMRGVLQGKKELVEHFMDDTATRLDRIEQKLDTVIDYINDQIQLANDMISELGFDTDRIADMLADAATVREESCEK